MVLAFNKPYGVLSAFTSDGSPNRTLAEFGFPPQVYPLGRLDADSEGLLLLSDENNLNHRLLNPRFQHHRTYWSQVDKWPEPEALRQLHAGVKLPDHQCLPCEAWILNPQPQLAERVPPIRLRKNIPTCWIGLTLTEGKNRQVRRMTAAVGHPTLRLIRVQIAGLAVGRLPSGTWRQLTEAEAKLLIHPL